MPAPPPPRRLKRAALMAAGATLMGAAACNTNDGLVTDAGGKPARDAVVDYGGPVPVYGAFTGTGGGTGAGGQVATGGANGAGGSSDAGSPDAGDAAARDAAQDRTVIAIYGAATPNGADTPGPGRSGNG
jgi:hypothetical protein